jgi:CrcB protein
MAEQGQVELHTHLLAGHPVRDIVQLAAELKVELLVIGATGHSALYERMIGSRADGVVQLAQCPVLVVDRGDKSRAHDYNLRDVWRSSQGGNGPWSILKSAESEIRDSMENYIWVAVGGALGTAGRYWLSGLVAWFVGETFPWGTLLINVSGSFIIGFFAALTGPDGRVFVGSTARQFVMVGLCGGFTTFSSFSLQTLNLMNDGEWFRACGNIGLSVALCLIAV